MQAAAAAPLHGTGAAPGRPQLLLPSMAFAAAAGAGLGPQPSSPPPPAAAQATAGAQPQPLPALGCEDVAAVTVLGFGRMVSVFSSKQRPKLLTIYCRWAPGW